MPAFQLSQQSPADVLQLCGAKRKAESDTEMDHLSQPDYDHNGLKRICLCREENEEEEGESLNNIGNVFPHNEQDETEISCDVSYTNKHSVVAIEMDNDKTMMAADLPAMPQSVALPRVGEVSSSGADVTESQVTDSMEVDYMAEHLTPCEQTSSSSPSSICKERAEIDRQFCADYCGLGSVSPASGVMRCYCRPSWEGMVEMQPFRSDFY